MLLLVSFGGIGFGSIRSIVNFIKKDKSKKQDNKRILISSVMAFVISFVGIGITAPSPSSDSKTDSISISSEETIDTKETVKAKETNKKSDAEKKKQEESKIAEEKKSLEEQENNKQKLKEIRSELVNLNYEGTQTIEINDNIPLFSPLDLSLENGSWEAYGDLDNLNRATSAEAMLNQDLMPTEKRGDISNVKPTGWKNKKLGNGYLYNRSHLIGFALSGENDNWKNLITGTTQLNNPEMLRHEMDIKYYLEKDKDNYVRYSVTPIFKDDELLARGVHLMAQSIDDGEISFNVYIFNVQDGAKLNYADGSSETDEEIAATKKKEEENRIAAEKAKKAEEQAEKERIEAERIATEEAERIAAEQAEKERILQEDVEVQKIADEQVIESQHDHTEGEVFITKTGERYHAYAHGNGDFWPTSLSDAQSRGLTPCQVCW